MSPWSIHYPVLSKLSQTMKIDGVSLVEPSATDDPYAMGPVAVEIDCDLDALAHKVRKVVCRARDVIVCLFACCPGQTERAGFVQKAQKINVFPRLP